MNLFKLEILLAVCQTRSFTRAAEQLSITQSAVSKSIKELETAWEIKLVIRNGNQIMPTAHAESLSLQAMKVLQQYTELESLLRNINGKKKDKLKIGSGASVTKAILETITLLLSERYSSLELEIYSGNSESTEALLKKGLLDYGIVATVTLDNELIYLPIFEDTILPVCHKDHPLTGKPVSLADLQLYPILAREKGSATQQAISRFLQEHGLLLPFKNLMDYNETLLSHFILHQQCIAFISIFELRENPVWKQVTPLMLHEGPIRRTIYLAYLKSNAGQVLLRDMKQIVKSMRSSREA